MAPSGLWGGATQALRERAAAVRSRLDRAPDAYADGTIDGQQLTRITAELRPDAERLDQPVKAASTAPDFEDIAGPDIRHAAGQRDRPALGRHPAGT